MVWFAADRVMIPMQCEYFALEGLTDLVNTLRCRPASTLKLKSRVLLRTMYDPRSTLAQQVAAQ